MYPSSVVQTGVKFFGCENKMAHPFPIHSWKLIRPCVVSAAKLGASLFILNGMAHLRIVKTVRSSSPCTGRRKLLGVPRCAEPRHVALHVGAALGTDLGTVYRRSVPDTSPAAAA